MIPESIDPQALLRDLNAAKWKDCYIEEACGFSKGYVSQIKCGNVKNMSYEKGAKLYNLHQALPIQTVALTEQENQT